jgi:ribose 5-phosphate isomerase RpiB
LYHSRSQWVCGTTLTWAVVDANVLAIGLRLTSAPVAREIVVAFLAPADVDPDERANIDRVEQDRVDPRR